MDRRQIKTRAAIFKAFSHLLDIKEYKSITVQDIIDEANIGRSTFYAHFETKDELLRAMCTEIFNHVFQHTLPEESQAENAQGYNNLKLKLSHTLYHIGEKKDNIKSLLKGQSSDLYMKYLKEYLNNLFSRYADDFPKNIPEEFVLNHLVGSFSETIKWWILNGSIESPEKVADYYMKLVNLK